MPVSKSKYLLLAVLLCVGVASAVLPESASSQVGIPAGGADLGGYAWSSNIGWISLSCDNTSTCGASNYGVTINTSGSVTGYAWSSNIGWIRFGGLSGFPAGSGNVAQNAATAGTYPNLTMSGWARACSVYATGCSGTLKSTTELGGWDGWISLRGSNHTITTNATGMDANSFAWGSDVLGWIDFSSVAVVSTGPTINSFTATPNTLTTGDTSTLTYNVTAATSCTASNNNGDTTWINTLPLNVAAGDQTVSVTPPTGATTFTLTCTDGTTSVSQTATVTATAPPVPVIAAFTATPNSLTLGGTVDLDYEVTGATSCSASNNRSESDWTSGRSIADTDGSHGPYEVTPTYDGVITYRLSCSNAAGTVNRDVTVTTTAPPTPTVTFSGDRVVRSGETADITVDISSAGGFSCSLLGPGMPGSASPITTAGIVTETSDPLFSTTVFEIDCGVSGSFAYQVQVIPTFQEV